MDTDWEQQLDQLHPQIAQLYQQGQHEAAVELPVQVVDLAREHFEKHHHGHAHSLKILEQLYLEMETTGRPSRSTGRRWNSTAPLSASSTFTSLDA